MLGHYLKLVIYDNSANLSKRMKILTFIVSCYLAQVLAAQDMNEIAISALDENELILSKLVAALSEMKSSQCKSDLNLTVNAFRDGRPWAIASKNELE